MTDEVVEMADASGTGEDVPRGSSITEDVSSTFESTTYDRVKMALTSATNPKLQQFRHPFLLAVLVFLPVLVGVVFLTSDTMNDCREICAMTPLSKTANKSTCSVIEFREALPFPQLSEDFGFGSKETNILLKGKFGKGSDILLCEDEDCETSAFALFDEPIRPPPGQTSPTSSYQLLLRLQCLQLCAEGGRGQNTEEVSEQGCKERCLDYIPENSMADVWKNKFLTTPFAPFLLNSNLWHVLEAKRGTSQTQLFMKRNPVFNGPREGGTNFVEGTSYILPTSEAYDFGWVYALPTMNRRGDVKVEQGIRFLATRSDQLLGIPKLEIEYCQRYKNAESQDIEMCLSFDKTFPDGYNETARQRYHGGTCCPDMWRGGYTFESWSKKDCSSEYENKNIDFDTIEDPFTNPFRHCVFFGSMKTVTEYEHVLWQGRSEFFGDRPLDGNNVPTYKIMAAEGSADTMVPNMRKRLAQISLLVYLSNTPEFNDRITQTIARGSSVYCCEQVCPSFTSALGSSLGYASYLEAVVTMAVLLVYFFATKDPLSGVTGGTVLQRLKLAANVAGNLDNEDLKPSA